MVRWTKWLSLAVVLSAQPALAAGQSWSCKPQDCNGARNSHGVAPPAERKVRPGEKVLNGPGCWCDSACVQFRDCCPDAQAVCGSAWNAQSAGVTATAAELKDPNLCKIYAGKYISNGKQSKPITDPSQIGPLGHRTPTGCYCDEICVQHKDCCVGFGDPKIEGVSISHVGYKFTFEVTGQFMGSKGTARIGTINATVVSWTPNKVVFRTDGYPPAQGTITLKTDAEFSHAYTLPKSP